MDDKKISEADFNSLDFLDFEYALECCASSFDLYLQAVRGFVGKDYKEELLTRLLQEKDYVNYSVNIHAVKSSSSTIGALMLSNQARALEYSLKEGNLEYVENNHLNTMEEYHRIADCLRKILIEYGCIDNE